MTRRLVTCVPITRPLYPVAATGRPPLELNTGTGDSVMKGDKLRHLALLLAALPSLHCAEEAEQEAANPEAKLK